MFYYTFWNGQSTNFGCPTGFRKLALVSLLQYTFYIDSQIGFSQIGFLEADIYTTRLCHKVTVNEKQQRQVVCLPLKIKNQLCLGRTTGHRHCVVSTGVVAAASEDDTSSRTLAHPLIHLLSTSHGTSSSS